MANSNHFLSNNEAWLKIFSDYNILGQIKNDGFFVISSSQIKQYKEPRLMAKIDHKINLPEIFRENHLSILPISRSKYIIGYFTIHYPVAYNRNLYKIHFEIPESIAILETINEQDLFSESAALNFAFISGIINDLFEEKFVYSVSGRMSTKDFNFNIKDSQNDNFYQIEVCNSQCEIDGGFESENHFLIVEVKNYSVDDFCIRQLYYPYRLWLSKIRKKVVPILMTYSNDIFSFFVYEFQDKNNYSSLSLVEQKHYVIGSDNINRDDVLNILTILSKTDNSSNAFDLSFPQADKFERIVDLLGLLIDRDLSKQEITENYQFDSRQTQYYTNAAQSLGLIERYQDSDRKVYYRLTKEGKLLINKDHKQKMLCLIEKILENNIFCKIFDQSLELGYIPSKENICQVMRESGLELATSTIERRASTVRGWIEWIWYQID